tara:strand:+ start:159 stop:554 length:396 start_codon:yes stop_codon:yes gene_type:complete
MINLKNSVFKLVENAKININYVKTEDAIKIQSYKINMFADIRDIREISKDGRILGYKHVLSVILEFCIYIKSQYQKKFLNKSFNFTFYCASDWRSVLATLVANSTGFLNTPNQKGGYNKWLELNHPIEEAR